MIRTGKNYLLEIDDGRVIWLDGKKISSITDSISLKNAANAFAALYDQAAASEYQEIFYTGTDGDRRTSGLEFRAFYPSRNSQDMALKHQLHAAWAESSFGFLGRSPDYMAAGLSGFITSLDAFCGELFDGRSNLKSLYARAREGNLFISFALTNIKRDRSKPLSDQKKMDLDIGVRSIRETDAGVYVSGVKGIATAAIYSDEIIVGSIEPLPPADAAYGMTFCIRPSTPGVKLISRKSYSTNIDFEDAPLSSCLDENDAILVMDEVFVPWERILTYRDTQKTFEIWWHTPAYASMAHQASIRFYKKLEFLAGLAYLIIRSNGSLAIPEIRGSLGRLVGYAQLARSIAFGAEREYEISTKDGDFIIPNRNATYAQRIFSAEVYPKFIHELRMYCGGSLIYLPESIADFSIPELGVTLKSYLGTSEASPVERTRLLKLVWDVTSTEFASRHAHYEQFYQGAPHVYLSQMTDQKRLEELGKVAGKALHRKDFK